MGWEDCKQKGEIIPYCCFSLPTHKDINHTDFLSLNSVKIKTFPVQKVTDVGLWNKFNFYVKLSAYVNTKDKYSPKIMDTKKAF